MICVYKIQIYLNILDSSENKSRRVRVSHTGSFKSLHAVELCQERIWKVFNIRMNEHGFDESRRTCLFRSVIASELELQWFSR
jgi:hypothetical protein